MSIKLKTGRLLCYVTIVFSYTIDFFQNLIANPRPVNILVS